VQRERERGQGIRKGGMTEGTYRMGPSQVAFWPTLYEGGWVSEEVGWEEKGTTRGGGLIGWDEMIMDETSRARSLDPEAGENNDDD
jgi:hypothetical protein